MYGPLQGKLRLYGSRKIAAGSVALSSDWEVFASILVNDLGQKLVAGIDLTNFEVKSAKRGASYEYQYHKDSGRSKLAKDQEVGHLFFDYFDNLKEVDLRYAHGSELKEFFQKWLADYPDLYLQRYRRNIPYGWVKKNAALLMTLSNGEVTFPKLGRESPTAHIESDGSKAQE